MQNSEGQVAAAASSDRVGGRPTARLPMRELLQISVYWLAINSLWGALDIQLLPYLMDRLVCAGQVGEACLGREQPIVSGIVVSKEIALALIAIGGALVAMIVQPVVAAISDFTVTRWGRRKPYIFIGTVLDIVFLAGLAMSNTFVAVMAFVLLLQFSSNFAQGPFQGYVPDLVPASQVGLASGLMGLMIIVGVVAGVAAAGVAIAIGAWWLGLVAVGFLEVTTMLATVLTVREPRKPPPPRAPGRLVDAVGGSVREVLAERNFLWLLASRFAFLVAGGMLPAWALYYMRDSLGFSIGQAALAVVVASVLILVFNGLSVFPSGALSDRYGRKAMIYLACGIAFVGMLPLVVAPRDPALSLELNLAGSPVELLYPVAGITVILVGAGIGTFLAVDWALMTDIIPKHATGRFMGISNVATAIARPAALLSGGLLISVTNAVLGFGTGPRAALLLGAALFIACALLLRPVDPTRREDVITTEASATA